jgi:hypothetical protein
MDNIQEGVRIMVFNATFNSISAISSRSVLYCREQKYLDKTINLPQITDKRYHIMLYQVHLFMSGIRNDNVSGL